MPTGRIKYYNFDKGFGFIAQDSSDADVFLHSSAIKHPEYEELRVGQRVKYSVIEGEKGLVAQNVEVLLTPTERRWLRQGKAIIPRGYGGFPGQSQDQFGSDEALSTKDKETDKSEPVRKHRSRDTSADPTKLVSKPRTQPTTTKNIAEADEATIEDKPSKQLSFGDLYILKQINFETSMFFALYGATQIPATVLEMTLSSLTLNNNGTEQQIPKTDVKYCYKDVDAEKLQVAIEVDEAVKAQQLTQLPDDAPACELDTETVRQARKDGSAIEITLREGEIFRGTVDWVCPYEIKLILENGSKVVIFRHAVYSLSVD